MDANRVLNEGSTQPMAITEFRSSLKIHATLETDVPTATAAVSPAIPSKVTIARAAPLRLRNLTQLSVREHILTGYTQTADLEISSVIQPVPRVVDS